MNKLIQSLNESTYLKKGLVSDSLYLTGAVQ